MNAILLPFDVLLAQPVALSSGVYRRDDVFWRSPRLVGTLGSSDTHMSRAIPGVVENAQGGLLIENYTDTYYNNIYLIPSLLEFGAVVSDISRTFYLWNAYLRPVSLSSLQETSTDGLVLSSPIPIPSEVKALQFLEFDLTATPNGPPVIDAKYDFVFDIRTYRLTATGIRAEIWDYLPNWSKGYKVNHEYRTEVIPSRSGKEQRRALRQTARKSLEFEVVASSGRLRHLRSLYDGWQDKNYVTPELTKSVHSTSVMDAGEVTMGVDTTPHWLRAEAIVILSHNRNTSIRIVQDVVGGEVTFTAAGETDWPVGTIVYPGLSGRVLAEQSIEFLTSGAARMAFRFDVTPGSEGMPDLGTPFEKYNDVEVFQKQSNWAQPMTVNFQSDVESLDYGRGVTEHLPLLDFGRRITQATFLSRTREEAVEIEAFFHRNKGRRGSFYMPTWMPDIEVVSDLSSLNRFMTAKDIDLVKYYRNDPVFRHMLIRFVDGTHMIRPLVSVEESDGNTVIDTGDVWPRDIKVSEILMVSWLTRMRFATDILSLEWLTDQVAQFQISVQTLEDIQ